MLQHAETKNIYERITFKTFVKIDFAAYGGDADAITVMRDAGDDAGEKAAIGQNSASVSLPMSIGSQARGMRYNWPEPERV